MSQRLQRVPWFFVLGPLTAICWLRLHPLALPPDWHGVGLAAIHLAGGALGYVFIRRLGVLTLEIGWTLLCLQITLDLCGKLTSGPVSEMWLQTFFAVSGYIVLTLGVVRSHSVFVTQAERAKLREEQLRHDATHDKLTGLANRAHFEDELAERWGGIPLANRPSIALLFIDLDGFKGINDHYGHLVGDELLQIVARRLRAAVRREDMVARVGGDEFAALITGLSDSETLDVLLARVHERLTRGAVVSGATIRPQASIGVARGSERHERPKELLRAADAAMYAAKRAKLGRGPSAAA